MGKDHENDSSPRKELPAQTPEGINPEVVGGKVVDERVVDDLIAKVLREGMTEPDDLPDLTPEARTAMEALGPDFVRRVLSGEVTPRHRRPRHNE